MLVIQNTTELNVTHHPATHGLGLLDHARQRGLRVHSALAVSSDGAPMEPIHQAGWNRDPDVIGTRQRRRQLATHHKERQRWQTAQAATQQAVPPEIAVITIADREADIDDLDEHRADQATIC